jgi:TolB-like protein/DNA-binding winged helix-turn-helix (wHTH) protein
VPGGIYKFGDFELDGTRFELRRNGRVQKLERIPTELLILLAEKEGCVATRQEIIERLWGKDVFVDTEHGINTAVRKVRMALREHVDRPRFIQTVSGKGYRFVPEAGNTNANGNAASATPHTANPDPVSVGLVPASIDCGPTTTDEGLELQKWLWAAVALLVVAGATLLGLNVTGLRDRVFAKRSVGPIRSIAVLPLANLSGDPSQDYYADGLTDEFITALARNRSLRVVSRTSAMRYKAAGQPLTKIAEELGVDGILEGSVNRGAKQVHINLQLIYAATDTHVWAESYDRDLNNAQSLPEELSATIAREAKISSAPAQAQHYVNPEAHDAYLRGRYLWMAGNWAESQKYFERAIQLQSDYAPAWAGLCTSILARAEPGRSPLGEAVDKAEAAARKAIELDDALAEGHHAMVGVYLFGKWDWGRADAESRRSLELDPNFSEAHHIRSYILFAMNRPDEALQEQKRATEIDPFERPWALGRAYYYARQYDASIEEFRMRAQAGTSALWVHSFLSQVYGFKGMEKESERELEEDARINFGEKTAAGIRRAYERGGRKAVLELQLNYLNTRSRKEHNVSHWQLAEAYAALEMKAETLQQLQAAYFERSEDLVFLQDEPVYDFLHPDEGYRALVKKIGLTPAY